MVQPQSLVKVVDNSGAKEIICIRILGKGRNQVSNVGDIIIAVVKEAIPNTVLKKSDIVRAVIVRTKKGLKRKNGIYVRFDDNAAVIVNKENIPKGTRIFGPVARELRDQNFMKIVSLAPEVI